MSITWKIPRNCLAWLLLSQVLLIIPHIERLPFWVLGTYAVCACWRVMVFQGRWSFPHKIIKALLAFACIAGIFQSYGTIVGLEPTVALLFSGFSLKLLEAVNKRDMYVIIFAGYFVALTEFLFSQDFFVTCLVFVSVLLLTTALVALHQQRYEQLNMVSLKKAGVLYLQAVPLMIVAFIIFPRFEPLWDVPLPSHQAKTGIGDTLSPGDISNLTQNDDLAFRVNFQGQIPPVESLYWRALVLSAFDGRRWHQHPWQQKSVSRGVKLAVREKIKRPIKYRVIQEATYQPWLFSLALANSDDKGINFTNDLRLIHRERVHTRIQYDVESDVAAKLDINLGINTHQAETKLPIMGNTKTHQFAKQLYLKSANNKEYVQSVLNYFSQQPFVYTLKPPLLGRNSIDDFLFTTQKGFCGHYASAFVFLMRSVGIAARVVTGYQGGEINPITGSVLVHQFDAHAWAEVWFDNEGWVRIDPTSVVSPLRVRLGLQAAMKEEASFLSRNLLSPLHYKNVPWINQLRLQTDAMRYYWQSAVLQYKGDSQLHILQLLLGKVTPLRIASLLLGVGVLVILIVSFYLFKHKSDKPEASIRIYLWLCKRLEKAGFKRGSDEGAIDFARRMAEQEQVWGKSLFVATRIFVTLTYDAVDKNQRKNLLKQLRRESLKIVYLLHVHP